MSAIHQTTANTSSSMGVRSYPTTRADDLSPATTSSSSSSAYVNKTIDNITANNNNNAHNYTTTVISPVSPISTSSSSGGSSSGGGTSTSLHNRQNSSRNLSIRKRLEKSRGEENNLKGDTNHTTAALHNITNSMARIGTMDTELIAIKSKFEAEFRRFSMQRSELTNLDSFRSLIEHFHRLFNIQFCIFYTDPVHGDQLPISNDNNFKLAISSAKPLLRIVVQRKGEIFDSYAVAGKKKNFLGQILPSSSSTPTRPKISMPEDFRQVSSIIDVDIVPETCRRVRLVKHGSDKPLGFYIRDGTSVRVTAKGLEKVPGIFISRLVPGGLAESTGLLAVNDEVLEVNGIEVQGKSLDQVTDMMVANSSNLIITTRPANQSRAGGQHAPLSSSFSSNTISTSTPSHHLHNHHHHNHHMSNHSNSHGSKSGGFGGGNQTNSLERRQHPRLSKQGSGGAVDGVSGVVLRNTGGANSQNYRYSQLYQDPPSRSMMGYEFEHLQRSNAQRHSAHRFPTGSGGSSTSEFSAHHLHQANPVYRSVCLVNNFGGGGGGGNHPVDARRALQGPPRTNERLPSIVPDIVNVDDDDDDDEDEVKDHFTQQQQQQHHF